MNISDAATAIPSHPSNAMMTLHNVSTAALTKDHIVYHEKTEMDSVAATTTMTVIWPLKIIQT
jgi:hypothetical protein